MGAMKYLPRREGAATRKVKSSRATEMGIAGHQAAMKALGNATNWESGEANTGSFESTRYAVNSKTLKNFEPGAGNVDTGFGPESRGVSTRHQTSYRTGLRPGEAHVEPNVVHRHKPTEDF